ncbi:N-acetylmuramoyl-L-alanine amidase CwlD [Defluviitalea phaphyphila]|uniref:N-acetylmuramoyl-L-alanine amidase CwlD n=1 Tax=Defluviitalea phaphyphila TaxID=1473580 RepID=UPI0007308090|nr:N-acetylmuramoyl-L-alanine amidase CwlD [Defluviitalea phaphyphila]
MNLHVKTPKIYVAIGIILVIFLGYNIYATRTVSTFALPTAKRVIVIDPGHGGFDPGKLGTNGVHEKDINLAIALKLQSYLEQSGAYVIITRNTDEGLNEEGDTNKKSSDMRRRKELINSSEADILISIHQNSFTQSKYKGAQVFYHGHSKEGERLAKSIQNKFKEFVDATNKREAKANTDYYILRTTEIPAVIVECGFLSNPEEEANLNNEIYQEKVAWAIYAGIVDYFNNAEEMNDDK